MRRVIPFALLACAISWLLWAPLFGDPPPPVRSWLYYSGVLGPAAAALIFSRQPIQARWRVPARWYLFALLVPFAIRAVSILAFGVIRGQMVPIEPRQFVTFAPLALLILFLVPFEELGWRGYALPRLQEEYSWLVASLIVGVIWGLWHAPLAWAPGTFQSSDQPLIYVSRFVITILPVSCVAGWLFNRSEGSIVIVSLYHFAVDIAESVLVLPAAVGISILWISTALTTVLVVFLWRGTIRQ